MSELLGAPPFKRGFTPLSTRSNVQGVELTQACGRDLVIGRRSSPREERARPGEGGQDDAAGWRQTHDVARELRGLLSHVALRCARRSENTPGNINELSQSLAATASGPARARAVAAFLAQHPDVFGSFKTAHDSAYLYYPGHDHGPDAVRTSQALPVGQCVSEFNYSIDPSHAQCVSGQRIRAYSLSFIKDKGRVMLRTGVLGLDSCN
ncbi:hypothetical protein [Burkholderia sp. HI2761]|uniref:hypothetical protein n=1 Tax=unclassified Burkholderia TaxID=2613784 RepID=UPI00268BC82C